MFDFKLFPYAGTALGIICGLIQYKLLYVIVKTGTDGNRLVANTALIFVKLAVYAGFLAGSCFISLYDGAACGTAAAAVLILLSAIKSHKRGGNGK